jgi:hypothetical protein
MRKFKRWLLNTFFKNELLEIQNETDRKNQDDIEIVHQILSEKNSVIVGEADNKKGEHVFVVQSRYGKSIYFKLYSNKYKAIDNHPRIMATYNPDCGNNPYIEIEDILVVDNNSGNGSILMPYFIEYCRNNTDAKRIKGSLSYYDSGHFERSIHFYKKHGYEVKLDEMVNGSPEGVVLKELSMT